MRNWLNILLSFLLLSCSEENKTGSINVEMPFDSATILQNDIPVIADTTELERSILNAGLVNVGAMDSTIKIELKYSTRENFMNEDMYGDFDRLYLHPEVASKLINAQKILKKKNPSLSLLVYDGVRPLSIQQRMWDESKLPLSERGKFLSNPKSGSLHNYGAAVDLTICDSLGIPLDMGSAYDDPSEISFPSLEQKFLSEGKLSKEQIQNRQLLRSVMRQAGFTGIESEWWHFNALSRAEAKSRYKIVE